MIIFADIEPFSGFSMWVATFKPGISYQAIHVIPLSGYPVGQDFYHPFLSFINEQ